MRPFVDRMEARASAVKNWLCVGIDPDPELFPDDMRTEDVAEFTLAVVKATKHVAAAYKPNCAFFEALGELGDDALRRTIDAVPKGVPIILDGKRNDIGNTARKYAQSAFDDLGVDAVTVTPYLGLDTVKPFADYEDKGVFLLARTSNRSAGDFQDLLVDGVPLYQKIVQKAMDSWQPQFKNLGFVAGATYPEELGNVRELVGERTPLLIPGVGAQGADAIQTLKNGADAHGRGAIVNVGRAILYAGSAEDWTEEVRLAAEEFAAQLQPLHV